MKRLCVSALLVRGFTCLNFLSYLFSLDSLSEILFLSLADKSDFVRLSDFFNLYKYFIVARWNTEIYMLL